jgi:hypothetical protein
MAYLLRMRRYSLLFLLTALLSGFSCLMAIRHQRQVIGTLWGAAAVLNGALFWENRKRTG